MSSLYIVGTPIGNLSDITERAKEILSKVDLIYSEDTRVTRKLLDRFDIKVSVKSFHEHSKDSVYKKILEELESGLSVAFVTDAGTPGVCDPGGKLVKYVSENSEEIEIIPIPGVSSLPTAISVSGLNTQEFTFLGFPPHKKGRETFFKKIADIEVRPVIFFESTHRLAKALESIAKNMGENKEIVVAKELTKLHEEVFRGEVSSAQGYFIGPKSKGEFVIIVP